MSVLKQSCLFTVHNQALFDVSKKRRITQEDIGNALGIATTTVDRCLKGVGNVKTVAAVKAKADELGYVRVDKWASIKPEFILGYDESGQPKIDEQAVCILRQRGNHARNIGTITGLCKKRIKQILEKNGLSTKNLQRIEENGLSLRQRTEFRAIRRVKDKQTVDQQFLKRGSELRNKTLEILKKYKNGMSVESAARSLGIGISLAWRLTYKTKSYFIIKNRKVNKSDYAERLKRHKTYSIKFSKESAMIPLVHLKLIQKYPNAKIVKEHKVLNTFTSTNGQRGLRADFVIFQNGLKPIAVEVKNKTTSNSFKTLFGQVLVYQAAGFNVQCVIPDDAFCPPFAKEILSKSGVEIWTV